MITLDTATKIAAAAFAEGAKNNLVNMSVVVTDVGGNMRLGMRADGQGIFGIKTAMGKAVSALGFNRSSLSLNKVFGEAVASTVGINGVTDGVFVPIGGGVVAIDADGVIVGAAAVSGGAPATDDAVIRAALRSVGLGALE
jgi:uncharacterized protein GlcG (DUF336 family)